MWADTGKGYGGASISAIQSHYDLSNDFYGLWLDTTRTYSCALWSDTNDPDETLETAQGRKLDHHIMHSRAAQGSRVLDIGCGWGSLLTRLVNIYYIDEAVGLTLSEAQFDWARHHLPKGAKVHLENWYDHPTTSKYDAIISIGAFEHFASYGQTRRQRVSGYREFFVRCRDWLPRGGRISLQTMTKGNNVQLDRRVIANLEFVIDTIFPDSELPWLSELLEASERALDVVTLRSDPDHYERTCRAWLENLRGQRSRARDLVGDEVVANYEKYLDVCAEQFAQRHLGLVRIVLERP